MYLDKTLKEMRKFTSNQISFLFKFAPQLLYGTEAEKKRFSKILEKTMEFDEFLEKELKENEE